MHFFFCVFYRCHFAHENDVSARRNSCNQMPLFPGSWVPPTQICVNPSVCRIVHYTPDVFDLLHMLSASFAHVPDDLTMLIKVDEGENCWFIKYQLSDGILIFKKVWEELKSLSLKCFNVCCLAGMNSELVKIQFCYLLLLIICAITDSQYVKKFVIILYFCIIP